MKPRASEQEAKASAPPAGESGGDPVEAGEQPSSGKIDGPHDVKSARRVLEILEVLAAHGDDGLRFPEIAERLGIAKSSCYALVSTLVRHGWLLRDEPTRTYRIGCRAWEAGQGYATARDLALAADPHLRAACAELNETVQLGILDGVEVLYIAKVESDRPFRLRSRAGMRMPAWATGLGKVLLASLSPEELRRRMANVRFERFTEETVTDLAHLEEILARIRNEGIGRDLGELNADVYCVAAPVLNQGGSVVAAMSCTLPKPDELAPGRDAELVGVIRRQATELSMNLGWRPVSAGRIGQSS